MRDFYVSSSSHRDNLPAVMALMTSIEELGLKNKYDWTSNFNSSGQRDEQQNIIDDIDGAASAALFVFLDSDHWSRGGMMEYGIRLFTGYVHHIGCRDPGYLFFRSYKVKHHTTTVEFLEWLVSEGGGICS